MSTCLTIVHNINIEFRCSASQNLCRIIISAFEKFLSHFLIHTNKKKFNVYGTKFNAIGQTYGPSFEGLRKTVGHIEMTPKMKLFF